MFSDRTYRLSFMIGGFWNFFGALAGVIFYRQIFGLANLPLPNYLAIYQAWLALAGMYGIAYYLVSRDMYNRRLLALMGTIGKIGFMAAFFYNMYFNDLSIVLGFAAWVDLVFTFFYGSFLIKSVNAPPVLKDNSIGQF